MPYFGKKAVCILTALTSVSLGMLMDLEATSGAWANPVGGDWNVAGNWTNAATPNAAGDKAGFIGYPSAAPFTITSSASETIGSLSIAINAPNNLTIDFGGNALVFDNSGIDSTIFFTGSPTFSSTTPITVENGGLSIIGEPFIGTLVFQDTLTFTGGDKCSIISGSVQFENTLNPGSLVLAGSTGIFAGAGAFSSPANLSLNVGAMLDLGTATTSANIVFVRASQLTGLGATLTINGPLTLSGGVYNVSNTVLSSGVSIIHTSGMGQSFIGTGSPMTISIPSVTPYLINVNPGNSVFDLSIQNVSFTPLGAQTLLKDVGEGTLLLSGTLDLPSVICNAGTVLIGQTSGGGDVATVTGNFAVTNTGILSGFGTIITSVPFGVVNDTGTVAPGLPDQIGTLTFNGDYQQNSGGTLLLKGVAIGNSDQLIVNSGAVSLDGVLQFEALPGATFSAGQQLVIIDNTGVAGGISGQFSTVQSNLPQSIGATVQYDATQVLLNFFAFTGGPCPPCPSGTPSMTTFFGLSGARLMQTNQSNLQINRRNKAVRDRLTESGSYSGTDAVARAKTPQAFSGALTASSSSKLIADYQEEKGSVDEQISVSRFRYNRACEPASIYVAPLGNVGNFDKVSHQPGFDFHSVGGLIGGDYAFSRAGVGTQIGYESMHGKVDQHWGKFDVQSVFGKIYGTFLPFGTRHLFLDLATGGSGDWYDIHRNVAASVAKGKPRGWEWDAYAGFGYDALFGDWRLTPLASMQYVGLYIADYKEHGAGTSDVKVGHQRVHSLRSWLGMSAGATFETCSAIWMPEIRGFWQHEFAHQNKTLGVAAVDFNTTSHFQVFGGSRNYGVVGAELRVLFSKYWELAASYDFNWNKQLNAHLFYLEAGINF
jgi:uncharacterized protein YhjY with autotransporter beta-barrel domain